MIPSLLLRPEGSYSWSPEDGVQEVMPTVGENVTVVEGQYGDAWGLVGEAAEVLYDLPFNMRDEGTMLFRVSITPNSQPLQHVVGTLFMRARMDNSSRLLVYHGVSDVIGESVSGPITGAVAWSGTRLNMYLGGILTNTVNTRQINDVTGTLRMGAWGVSQDMDGLIESVLIFPEAITDAEIHRISTMPEAWTMANVSRPEMHVMHNGELRRAEVFTKRSGLLKPVELR